MMMDVQKSQTTISPHTQTPLVTRQYPSAQELDTIIASSAKAQKEWQKVSLDDRIRIAEKFTVRPSSATKLF